jgi:hypothetical protein
VELVQDRVQWQDLVTAVLTLRVLLSVLVYIDYLLSFKARSILRMHCISLPFAKENRLNWF